MTPDLSITRQPTHPGAPLLDLPALEAVRRSVDHSAPLQAGGPWQLGLVQLLNDALATELVCALRYKRHHFTAHGLASPHIAEEFLVHANEETVHADRLARRIVQLGGKPDFAPDTLSRRSHASYDESTQLKAMIRANLVAERVAIEAYTQLIALVREQDPTTRRLQADIRADETHHADELQGRLVD